MRLLIAATLAVAALMSGSCAPSVPNEADLKPHKIENTMAFMFESRWVIRPTDHAMEAPTMQLDYDDVWSDFDKGTPTG